jgi:hypothetical protein
MFLFYTTSLAYARQQAELGIMCKFVKARSDTVENEDIALEFFWGSVFRNV